MDEQERSRFRDALKVRDFRIMVEAFLFDAVGGWAYSVVMFAYVYERTGSTSWVAAGSAIRWLPPFVFGPYLGVLGDRYNRKTVSMITATLSGIFMLGMAFVVRASGPVW